MFAPLIEREVHPVDTIMEGNCIVVMTWASIFAELD